MFESLKIVTNAHDKVAQRKKLSLVTSVQVKIPFNSPTKRPVQVMLQKL